jgi:outer membrane protein
MLYRQFVLLLILACGARGAGVANIGAEFFGPGTKAEMITLERAIEMALANNLDSKFEHVGIAIEEARRRTAAGNFDPVFSVNAIRESIRRPDNSNVFNSASELRQLDQINAINANTNAIRAAQGLGPLDINNTTSGISEIVFDQQNDRMSSGLQGRTPWGMRYGFQVEANKLRNTYSGDTREVIPEYQTSATITVIQPLLRNFGPDANLADLRIARLNKKSQILVWKQRVSATVQNVISTFYDMIYAMRDVELKEQMIESGLQLLSQNRRRLELGFMTPLDVQQAEVALSDDREGLIISKGFFMERQFALKRLILDELQSGDKRIFIPLTVPRIPVPKLDRTSLMQTALDRRYDYRSALLDAEVQEVRLRFARNQLWPQVDLVGTYGVNGLQGNYGDAFDQGFSGHTPEWSGGVQIQVPLGSVKERAQLNLVKGLKQQAIIKIKQTELNVGVDVDTVISRIMTNQQRVETARKTRELNEEVVRVAYKRLQEGQLSSFELIEQTQKLGTAQSRELATVAELNKSISQLWLATGTILERQGVFFDK